MRIVLAVAAGGAIGAAGRHLLVVGSAQWFGAAFPYGTLAANTLGSFLMGALIEVTALVWSPSPELRAMLAVGVLGGFTTFSAFSLDAVALYERGAAVAAVSYVLASVMLSLAGIVAGMRLLRGALR